MFYFLKNLLLAHYIPAFKHAKYKTWHQLAIFPNRWPLFCQIWIILTQLKLWVTVARHSFFWMKMYFFKGSSLWFNADPASQTLTQYLNRLIVSLSAIQPIQCSASTRHRTMLDQCCFTVYDARTTLAQYWVDVSSQWCLSCRLVSWLGNMTMVRCNNSWMVLALCYSSLTTNNTHCKHETLTQCCFDGSPSSAMMNQHHNNVGSLHPSCW